MHRIAHTKIYFNKVPAILIENAFYITQIYKDVLLTLLLKSVHITSNDHIVKILISGICIFLNWNFYREYYEDFQAFSWQERRYIQFIIEINKQCVLCPVPLKCMLTFFVIISAVQCYVLKWFDRIFQKRNLFYSWNWQSQFSKTLSKNKYICKDFQFIVEETYLQVYTHSYKCYVQEIFHKITAKLKTYIRLELDVW